MYDMSIGEAALMLCIFGGKTERENYRLFPNVEQSLRYMMGLDKLKGRERLSSWESKKDTAEQVKESVVTESECYQQMTLFG